MRNSFSAFLNCPNPAFVVTVLAITWKILKLVYKCVRFLVGCLLGVVLVLAVLCNVPCDSLDLWMGKHFNR